MDREAAGPGRPRPPVPADEGERGWHVPWTWVDGVLAFAVGLVISELLRQLLLAALPARVHAVVLPIAAGAGLIAGVLGWLGVRHPGSVRRLLGAGPLRGRAVLAGIGHGVVAFLVLNVGAAMLFTIAAEVFGVDIPPMQESLRETITDPEFAVVGVLYTVTIAALAEELYFRGLLFPALRRPLGRWPAIGVTGLLFGLIHLQPHPLAGVYVLTVLAAFGMYLAWAFDRSRHLAVPVLMHAVFNALTVVALIGMPG